MVKLGAGEAVSAERGRQTVFDEFRAENCFWYEQCYVHIHGNTHKFGKLKCKVPFTSNKTPPCFTHTKKGPYARAHPLNSPLPTYTCETCPK